MRTEERYGTPDAKQSAERKLEGQGGNRGGGAGGEAALGVDRERSAIHQETRKLAKAAATMAGIKVGDPDELDERDGMSGVAEVGRPHEGGRVDGVGANRGQAPQGGGSQGLHAVSLDSGDAYGSNQSGEDAAPGSASGGKLDRLSEDDPKDTDEMKSNQGVQSSPESGVSGGLQADRVYGNEDHQQGMRKGDLDGAYRPMADVAEVNHANALYAARARAMQKSEYVHVPGSIHAVVAPSGEVYANSADAQAAELAKGDSFYQNGSPTLDNRGALQKASPCGACGAPMSVWLDRCPSCASSVMAKSEAPVASRPVIRVERPSGMLRPPAEEYVHLPNGMPSKE